MLENDGSEMGGGGRFAPMGAVTRLPKDLGPTIASAVEDYERRVRSSKRAATADNTDAHLNPWQRRMAGRGCERTGQLTIAVVLDDLIWYRTTPSERTGELRASLSGTSYATVIKSFLSDCYDRGYISKRLLDDCEIPKGARGETCFPTSVHLNALLGIVDDIWDPELRPEIADWPSSILCWFPPRHRLRNLLDVLWHIGRMKWLDQVCPQTNDSAAQRFFSSFAKAPCFYRSPLSPLKLLSGYCPPDVWRNLCPARPCRHRQAAGSSRCA